MVEHGRRKFGLALVLGLTLVVAAACGGAAAPTQAGAASSGATASGATASGASASSAQNQTLVIAIPSDIQNMDPTLSSGTFTSEVLTNIYSFLIAPKLGTNSNGQAIGEPNQFVGGVAQSYTVSPNGKTVTFHLRPGIKFANGDPINANAVKFTYDRIFAQNGVTASLMRMAAVANANAITVTNPETVVFHLTQGNPLLFGNMDQFGDSILDPTVVKAHETASDPYAHKWLSTHATGTESGPYVFAKWLPGNEIVLKRNPNYWGTVKNQEVILKIIPDPSTRLTDLQSGAVDIAYDLPFSQLGSIKSNANVKLLTFPTTDLEFLAMNNTIAPFNNVLVRQAIAYATPYKTILQQALHGYGVPLTSPVPQGMPTHTSKFDTYKTDSAKAKSLLAQAGYPNGLTVTLDVQNGLQYEQATAVWEKNALKQAGINVKIDEMPGAAFGSAEQHHSLAFYFGSWESFDNDPFYNLYWMFKSPCCDYYNYKNTTVWNDISNYTLSTNTTARDAASVRDQQLIMQQVPIVPLFQTDLVIATTPKVHGYKWYPADDLTRYQWLFKN